MGEPQPQRAAGPAYWIFLPGLIAAAVFLLLSFQSDVQSAALFWVFAALIPTAGGLALRSAGERTAASVCAVLVLACYWVPAFLQVYIFLAQPALGFVLLPFAALVAVPTGALAWAATVSFSKTTGRRWATSAVILGTVPSIAIGISAALHGIKHSR
jgi:hypothetical protein